MSEPIPDPWKSTVCRIIRGASAKSIEWTLVGFQRWEADTFGAHRGDAYESILKALMANDILGERVSLSFPKGESWEFFFPHKGRSFYGKICLRAGGQGIQILSAHLPDKGRRTSF